MRRDPRPLADSPARPAPDSFEASLLRAIFQRALGAALASSLGAAGCASDDQGACKAYKPLELGALEPASPVDYVSLRVSYPGDVAPQVRASAGVPCSAATDMPACNGALERTSDGLEPLDSCGMIGECRNFVATTAGDEVKRYASREELLAFLGPIDSPDDALLLLAYDGKYEVECETTRVASSPRGFEVNAVLMLSSCPVQNARVTLQVNRAGEVKELKRDVIPLGSERLCIGRRPAGMTVSSAPVRGYPLGEHFAAMAELEAASVTAFEVLEVELAHHGAPLPLIAAARAAALDEVRHAEATASMARRFGGTPAAPRVEERALRSLEAIALDNATEGCVRETFGAMLGHFQAATAADARIAALMQDLAEDETRHAALALQIDAWIMPRLSRRARARIARARSEAVRSLARALEAEPCAELTERAGVPDARTAAQLLAAVSSELWSDKLTARAASASSRESS